MCLSTKILFGKGQISEIKHEIPPDARVLITYGGGSVFRNGVMRQVREALEGFTTFEFGGIEANPNFETLIRALPIVAEEKIDYLLAVGGGSVVDGTKFISVASRYYDPENLWEILLTRGAKITDCLPVGAVMTTAATGSEMNEGAVVTRAETGDKLNFFYRGVLPKFAVLDPTVTFSLSPRQTANGVIDAFSHTAEGYMTYPVGARLSDRFSEAIFSTLMEEGPVVLANPADYDARANIMWSATNALNHMLLTGIPADGVSHIISHELTALFGLDHGQALAALMPAVYKYEKEAKKQKLAQFARRVLGRSGSDDELADAAIDGMTAFFEQMGVGTHLSSYGLDAGAIPQIVQKLEEHGKYSCGEHRCIGPKEMGKILELAL